jgi:uncharacterized protein (DUF2236 family)
VHDPAAEANRAELPDGFVGAALLAGAANVVMQLSRLPVGRGVAESTVDSGRLDKRPVKRTRTTLTYLAIAAAGTEQERQAMRREVNRQHAGVRSGPTAEVPYDAFDEHLQLWVGACIYRGFEDTCALLRGPLRDPARVEQFYRHGARFATTLQVSEEMWPADRAAFEEYWEASLELVALDDVTRGYLTDFVNLGFLPAPLALVLGPVNRFFTAGFLPEPFREELGLSWSERDQRRFDAATRAIFATARRLPRVVREFPFNLCLWDGRRRVRAGRAIV